MRPALKFALQKELGGSYIIVLNSPVEIRSSQNWLSDFFALEFSDHPPHYAFKASTNYLSNMYNPLPVIEWHCNIAEYSYDIHDDHPHLHKQEEYFTLVLSVTIFMKALCAKKVSKQLCLFLEGGVCE